MLAQADACIALILIVSCFKITEGADAIKQYCCKGIAQQACQVHSLASRQAE